MKKVLIITLYGNCNFGNKLQNYAMQEQLKKLGCDVDTIRIRYRNKNILKYIYRVFKDIANIIKGTGIREKTFVGFSEQYIKYTRYTKSTNSILKLKGYDYYVYGSDQVWNPFSCGTSELFLGKLSDFNISYAASLGTEELPGHLENNYRDSLKSFKYISVREDRGKELIENITGRDDIQVLIDPTMLLNSAEWDKISKKPEALRENEKYILNYFLGDLSEERKNEIERIAMENNCKIINIMDPNDPFYVCGPSEFLYLEKNAFLICTDSFHSSVFAILYDRPFIVFDREQEGLEKMNSRIDTLINKFNLKNRRFTGKITKENLEHDYSEAYKILEDEREKSDIFLKNALEVK